MKTIRLVKIFLVWNLEFVEYNCCSSRSLFPFHAIRHAMVILMQKAPAPYRRSIVKGRQAFKQLSNEAVPNGKFVYDIRWTLACNFVLCH